MTQPKKSTPRKDLQDQVKAHVQRANDGHDLPAERDTKPASTGKGIKKLFPNHKIRRK